MYVIEIIEASSLDAALKVNLRSLVEQMLAALKECDDAQREFYRSKSAMNERQYVKRLSETQSGEKRDQLLHVQLAYRNVLANSVYRIQGAQRLMQHLGKLLHAQVVSLDTSDASAKTVGIALKSLIGKCTAAGADKPNAIVKELTRIADISQEKIEDALRGLFLQISTGRGNLPLGRFRNFSSQPIMAAEHSPEQKALWDACQTAEKLFYSVRTAFDEYSGARSKLNLPQLVSRLERAQAERDMETFEQVKREKNAAEAQVFVTASHYLALIESYQSHIDAFAAVIKAAASAVPGEVRGNKHLIWASNCMAGYHWLREMEMQLEICWQHHDPRVCIEELGFDADAFLAAPYPESATTVENVKCTPLA